MHNLHENVKDLPAWTAAAVTTNSDDITGKIIDRQGFEALEFIFHVGENAAFSGSNYVTLTIQEGDDSGLSDAAFPAAKDIKADSYSASTGVWGVVDATTEDDTTIKVGYLGNKRYVRVSLAVTGTITSGVAVGCAAVLGNPAHAPTS